jgi:predicted nuclease with TOPRIM domain
MHEGSATVELAELRDEMDTTLGVLRGVQLEHDVILRETQRTVARMEKVQQTHGRRLERLEDKVDHLEGRFDGLEGRLDGLDAKVDGIGETLQEVLRRLPARN